MADSSVNMATGMLNVAKIRTDKMINDANKKTNAEYDAFLGKAFASQVQSDANYQERQRNYTTQQAEISSHQTNLASLQSSHDRYAELSKIKGKTAEEVSEYKSLKKEESKYQYEKSQCDKLTRSIDYYENNVVKTDKFSFANKDEYQSFVASAEAQGILGASSMEKFNGYYVFETSKENSCKVREVSEKIGAVVSGDFHKATLSEQAEQRMFDHFSGTSNATSVGGVMFFEALRETEELNKAVNKAQRLYDIMRDEQALDNPFDRAVHDNMGNIVGSRLSKMEDEFMAFKNNPAIVKDSALMKRAEDILANKKNMTEATAFGVAMAEKYKGMIPLDAKGKFDIVALAGMSPSALKKMGMTLEERKLAITIFRNANENVKLLEAFKRPLTKLGYKVLQMTEDEDLNELVGYANKGRKSAQDIANILKKSGDISIRDKVDSLRRKLNGKKPVAKARVKTPNKVATKKMGTTAKKITKTRKNLPSKTYKTLARRNKLASAWGNSSIGKVATKVNMARAKLMETALGKAFSAVMKFVSTILVECLGIAIGLLAVIFFAVMIIICVVMTIPSFFETTTEDTVIYKLYEHLDKLETDWVDSLEDTDNMYSQREKLMYGEEYSDYNTYIAEQSHLYLEGNSLYISPFDFEPANKEQYCKKVTEYDGGSIITYAPNYSIGYDQNYNGGHTSNIKDILCMMDVMYQFDTDNSDDGTVGDLTSNALSFVFSDYFSQAKTNLKLSGACISQLWDSNALMDFSDSYKPDCTYRNLQTYCDTLFGASHQELINLDTMFFNVNTNERYGDINDSYDETYLETQLLTACPKAGEGGCCEADFLCFVSDGMVRQIGLLGTDGVMHPVSSTGANAVVKLDNSSCLNQKLITSSTADAGMFNFAMNSPCWKEHINVLEVLSGHNETANVPDTSYSIARNISVNSSSSNILITKVWYTSQGENYEVTHSHSSGTCNNELICSSINPFHTHSASCYGCTKTTDTKYGYVVTKHTLAYWWQPDQTCQGHHGHYCGGHVAVDVTGVVFSFTDDQIQTVRGENPLNTELQGKVEDIDYTTFASSKLLGNPAKADWNNGGNYYYALSTSTVHGLNLTGTTNWTAVRPQLPPESDYQGAILHRSADIFDIDHNISYGYGFFPIQSYKEYEGWTASNMEIALLKYNYNWGDEYGFDIPVNLGIPQLSESEINKIIAGVKLHYGEGSLSELRLNALRSCLTQVGNGQYSQLHHGHGYFLYPCAVNSTLNETHHLCSCTDCSGFASWHFISNGSTRLSAVGSTDTFYGLSNGVNWNGTNALPSDVLIKKGAGDSAGVGGQHALIFIGYVDEDIELSFGTIKAGEPITVDCTRLDYKGNIYLRNGGITTISDCSYIMNRGSEGNVWVVSIE